MYASHLNIHMDPKCQGQSDCFHFLHFSCSLSILRISVIYNLLVKADIPDAAVMARCLDTSLLAVICRCKAEAFLQLVINHELSDSGIKIGNWLMCFRFLFQTSSELSECTLFSEYVSEWIALKFFFHLLLKRLIKNLRFNVPWKLGNLTHSAWKHVLQLKGC